MKYYIRSFIGFFVSFYYFSIIGWRIENREIKSILYSLLKKSLIICPYNSSAKKMMIQSIIDLYFKLPSKSIRETEGLYECLGKNILPIVFPYDKSKRAWNLDFYRIGCGTIRYSNICFVVIDKPNKLIKFVFISIPFFNMGISDTIKNVYKNTL